jgi:hypothetical protein
MTVMLSRILEPFGIFGGLMLGLVVFMITYFGLRQDFPNRAWQIGLAAAGMGMVFFGFLLNRDDVTGIGWLLALIAAIIAFVGVIRGAPSPPGEARPTRPPTPPPRPPTTPGPRPGTVHTVRAQGSPHGRPLEATVIWETRPAEENVVRYEIEYWPRGLGGRLNPRRLRRRNRIFNAGAGDPVPREDGQRQVRIPLRTAGEWNFRVSAVNNIGNAGDWSNVVACPAPQPGPRRGELEIQVIYDGGSDDRTMWRYLSSIRVHIMDEAGMEGAPFIDTLAEMLRNPPNPREPETGTVTFDNLPEGIYFVSTEDLLNVYQEFDGHAGVSGGVNIGQQPIYIREGETARVIIALAPREEGGQPGVPTREGRRPEERGIITGRVVDEHGDPLGGIDVIINGQDQIYVSGADGGFVIPVGGARAGIFNHLLAANPNTGIAIEEPHLFIRNSTNPPDLPDAVLAANVRPVVGLVTDPHVIPFNLPHPFEITLNGAPGIVRTNPAIDIPGMPGAPLGTFFVNEVPTGRPGLRVQINDPNNRYVSFDVEFQGTPIPIRGGIYILPFPITIPQNNVPPGTFVLTIEGGIPTIRIRSP